MGNNNELKLVFAQPYLSVVSLPETTLPFFSIITGANGAGKTHLLQAIQHGHIKIQGLAEHSGGFVLYNSATFTPNLGQVTQAYPWVGSVDARREQWIRFWSEKRRLLITTISTWGFSGDPRLEAPEWLATANERQLLDVFAKLFPTKRAGTFRTPDEAVKQFTTLRANVEKEAKQQFENNKLIDSQSETPLLARSERSFDHAVSLQPSGGPLQLDLSNWFVAWAVQFERNRMKRFYAREKGKDDPTVLEDDEFRTRFGPEPWDLVNRVFASAGVGFTVNHPEISLLKPNESFHLQLIDSESKSRLSVDSLSSGERILLAIIVLLYQTKNNAISGIPRLLLLDEVDAPLHPTYTKHLLDMLQDEVVQRLGVAVILTTHSPSTVALAPRGSVFELVRKPRQIRAITPSEATQVLSNGYVSIAGNDVIIITEALTDQFYFQSLYEALARLKAVTGEPPLKFVAATKKNEEGKGGGCDQVLNWANKLHELGLDRFKGLIDRDQKRIADKVVKVLFRYAIENYMYDPVTLCALLVQSGLAHEFTTQDLGRQTASAILTLDRQSLQSVVNDFCILLNTLGVTQADLSQTSEVDYMNWQRIKIPTWWIDGDGHALEQTLRAALNPFAVKHNRRTLLKSDHDEIIRFQTKAIPEAISRDFVQILSALTV